MIDKYNVSVPAWWPWLLLSIAAFDCTLVALLK